MRHMYGPELAEIYDLMHQARGKDYKAEAEEVTRQVRARLPTADSLLDVACGTGAHLRYFRELFRVAEGLELSEPMRAIAQDRLSGTTVHHGDMRAFRLDRRFDVITCMFGSIGYVTGTDQLTAVLRRFTGHLTRGGIVAVDPWWFRETYLDGYVSGDVVTVAGRTVARVSHSTREGEASRMRVHYVVADAESGPRHFTETHLISLFTRDQYETAFTSAGFTVSYLEGLNSGRGLFIGALRPGFGEVDKE